MSYNKVFGPLWIFFFRDKTPYEIREILGRQFASADETPWQAVSSNSIMDWTISRSTREEYLRAKEIAREEEDKSPSGSGWLTIFDDYSSEFLGPGQESQFVTAVATSESDLEPISRALIEAAKRTERDPGFSPEIAKSLAEIEKVDD